VGHACTLPRHAVLRQGPTVSWNEERMNKDLRMEIRKYRTLRFQTHIHVLVWEE
jgi:hypothetical protein